MQAAEQYFEKYRHENLTKWDKVELINKWFPVIASSDLLSITGSIYKIYVDKRVYLLASIITAVAIFACNFYFFQVNFILFYTLFMHFLYIRILLIIRIINYIRIIMLSL